MSAETPHVHACAHCNPALAPTGPKRSDGHLARRFDDRHAVLKDGTKIDHCYEVDIDAGRAWCWSGPVRHLCHCRKGEGGRSGACAYIDTGHFTADGTSSPTLVGDLVPYLDLRTLIADAFDRMGIGPLGVPTIELEWDGDKVAGTVMVPRAGFDSPQSFVFQIEGPWPLADDVRRPTALSEDDWSLAALSVYRP